MIVGAKKFYFSYDFYKKTQKAKYSKIYMILITIVDKKIYYEYKDHSGSKAFGLGRNHL